MSDENNDLNTDQLVTDQDLNAEVVDQQNLTDQVVQDQNQDVLADGTPANKDVPYSELQKATVRAADEAKARIAAEEQTAIAQRTIELMQQNAQQQQVQQVAPKSTSQLALESLGITEEDLYEPKNIIKFQERLVQLEAKKTQQGHAVMQTQQFAMSHPDLSEVVGSVNPTTGMITQPTAELMALVGKKPYLAKASTQDLYNAMLDERKFVAYEKTATIQKEHQARTGVKTSTQPLGGSAAGGGGSGSQNGQQMLSREATQKITDDLNAGAYS